jgi:hypothetical protein
LEEATLEFMKYEVRDDARQEIIQKQDEIFEMKKTRHNAARQEVYRWDRLRNELEEKIERHKQSTKRKVQSSVTRRRRRRRR